MLTNKTVNRREAGFVYEELSERKKELLKSVVELYIEYGGPVGSKMISEHLNMNISTATIRNELAELAEMGYLIQPHTSSGRIPSEQAYRFYVDYLMSSYSETTEEIDNLNELLKEKSVQLDKIIDAAGRLAGTLTNLPAIAVISGKRKLTVKKFSLMQNDPYSFIIFMLVAKNNVRTRTFVTPVPLKEEEIGRIQGVLNEKLTGIDPTELTFAQLMEIEKMLGELSLLASPVIKCICEALVEGPKGEVTIDGVDRLLEYPEYSDMGSLKSMLGLFSRKEDLINAVETADSDSVNVYIGSENTVDDMNNSSFVFKTITVGGVAVGAIGIIGPCRMDYQKVIATIGQLSDAIGKMLEAPQMIGDGKESDDGGQNG